MRKFVCLGALVWAGFAAFAGSAVVDGTDFVVTADSGESYTNSTAVGNYSRLVKRGAGEVVLTAATTAFAGDVVIEAGTLAITDLKAVGTGTPVTVESGATFYLKTPHGSGQTAKLFTGHVVTISGDGVDGKGAIRYLPSNGKYYDDSLLDNLTLADDATVECDNRWGLHGTNGGKINLNGHRLRRIYNATDGEWMLNNCTVNGGGGIVEFYKGTSTFQGNVKSSADTTYVITNSGYLTFYGVSSIVPSSFKFFEGLTFRINSGTSATANRISGPVQLLSHAGGTGGEVTINTYNGTVLRLDGPLTGTIGTSSTSGTTFRKAGTGTLYLNGDIDLGRNTYLDSGTLMMTSTASRVIKNGFVVNGWSQTVIGDGHTHLNWIRLGNGSHRGCFRQTGGVLGVKGDTYSGESNGSVGHWSMAGGEAYVSNNVYFGYAAGSFGGFRQTGGLFKLDGGYMYAGRAGSSVFHQSGGTNDSQILRVGQNARFLMGNAGGISDVTVSGTGTVFATEKLYFGGSNKVSVSTFNMNNGATVKATRVSRNLFAAEGSAVTVNCDGGTLMPVFGYGWGGLDASDRNFLKNAPDQCVVWGKGLVIDTTECSGQSGGQPSGTAASHIPFKFVSPSGLGVESVALPSTETTTFVSSNYYGVARVVFESSTGWGASAYAEYDHAAKKVTHIVVTSRGCNYGNDTKAYLESPARTARYECALILSDNAGMAGELVKRGAPTLNLYATNTITGGIAVEEGTLYAGTTGVVPSNSAVRVESGATLQFASVRPTSLSTFTGAGSVTGCDITVTNAVRATCAELFAKKHATFSGNLTFSEGAVFEITDPENLETYKNEGSVTAFTATSVNGTPTLRIPDDYTGSTKWALFKKDSGTYNFGPIIGTMILLK